MTSIDYLDDRVTQENNTTGVRTPILVVDPDQGTKLVFKNRVPVGTAPGIPVYADLRDSNNNQLPNDTELILTAQRPEDNDFSAVSEVVGNISFYNNNNISEQQSEERIDQGKIELDGELHIRDVDTLRVEANSSVQISWSNSEFYFDRRAVEERQRED